MGGFCWLGIGTGCMGWCFFLQDNRHAVQAVSTRCPMLLVGDTAIAGDLLAFAGVLPVLCACWSFML